MPYLETQHQQPNWTHHGPLTASTIPTSVNTGNAVKGSWVQIVAATTWQADWVCVLIRSVNMTGQRVAIDIGIGASGSEQIVIPDLYFGTASSGQTGTFLYQFPLSLPSGVRIAARALASSTASSVQVSVMLGNGSTLFGTPLQKITNYGYSSVSFIGTSIDPGTTINTKGAYTQITSATTAPIKWLVVSVHHSSTIVSASFDALLDITIGASGSEQVILPDLYLRYGVTHDTASPQIMYFPISIPEGVAISARAQATSSVATDRLLDLVLYGVS